ncbi:MAG: PAS domain S-box protein [Gemmatimonadaceae bacterium]|nr:PAS domain S-box protein [Gemmatimonadaceae bacterium]
MSSFSSERVFQQLVELTTDFIVIIDGAGTIVHATPSLSRVMGFAASDLIGRNAFEFVHPDDHATAGAALADELAGRTEAWFVDLRFRDQAGGWIPCEVKGWRDPLAQPGEPHVIVHARDGRVRASMEARVREQDSWMRAVVEGAPLAIISVDTEFRVTAWNGAAERIFGWTERELLGQSLPTIPADAPEEREWLTQAMREGRSFQGFHTRRRRKDGAQIDVAVSIAPLRSGDGSIRGALKLVQDVSGRSGIEERFSRSQALDAAGRLAGGIAHEFNNLLATMLTSAQFLLEELPPDAPQRADAEAVVEAAKRATDLTKQLMTLGRRTTRRVERFDLGRAVREKMESVRETVPREVTVEVFTQPEPALVMADGGHLSQILAMLVQNAVEAMPRGGLLTLETARLTLDRADTAADIGVAMGDYAMLAVSDTGMGMTPEVRVRCFEPFFTTKEEGRSGLGLATVYSLARQAGGSATVASEAGIGTTVRVYIPIVEVSEPARVIAERAKERDTILLVEDDGALRAGIHRALRQHGYHVLDAAGGAEALIIADQFPDTIQLLVTDLVMPDITGRELARRLRTLRQGLRVLYISGYTSAEVVKVGGALTANEAFIQKPFAPTELVGAVRGLLGILR